MNLLSKTYDANNLWKEILNDYQSPKFVTLYVLMSDGVAFCGGENIVLLFLKCVPF